MKLTYPSKFWLNCAALIIAILFIAGAFLVAKAQTGGTWQSCFYFGLFGVTVGPAECGGPPPGSECSAGCGGPLWGVCPTDYCWSVWVPDPAPSCSTVGQPCGPSAANACGMTGSGTIDTNCNCTATVPSDSLCPAPPPDPTCADLGMVGIYPACTAPPDPTCADYGQVGVWPACTDPDPGCTPDNSCAAGTCMGSTCSDSCGNSYGGTMACVPSGSPNLTQPNVSYTPSGAFDPATGNYNSVNISFQTSNDGGADAGSSHYRLWFDPRGASDIDTMGSLGTISVSSIVTRSQSATNVPFGPVTIRVLVDSNNNVAESNEGDNERTISATLPAPDPGIIISSDRTQVRNQEIVQLSWDTRATYSMNCIVVGPGIGPVSFDPHVSGATGSEPSAPLNAKSEFTLRCVEPITNTVFTDSVIVETTGKIEEI